MLKVKGLVRVTGHGIEENDCIIPVGISTTHATALHLNAEHGNVTAAQQHKLNAVIEETGDAYENTSQDLFRAKSQEQFDHVAKQAIARAQDAQAQRAVSLSLKRLSAHRASLPEKTEEPYPMGGSIGRPDNVSGRPFFASIEVGAAKTAGDNSQEWQLWQTRISVQKAAGWKFRRYSIRCDETANPAGAMVGNQVVVAALVSGALCVYVTEKDEASGNMAVINSMSFVFPFEHEAIEGPLSVTALADELVAVSFHSGVCVWDRQRQTAFLHAIVHPAIEKNKQQMITSILLKNATQLLFGTALGCIWNVHPTEPQEECNQFAAFPKVTPIRLIRTVSLVEKDGGEPVTITGAATSMEIFIIPPDGEFTRCIVAPRPLDFVIFDHYVYVLSKYGSIIVYNLLGDSKPYSIEPPSDTCAVRMVTPWYQGLALSANGRGLATYYPDGLVVTCNCTYV